MSLGAKLARNQPGEAQDLVKFADVVDTGLRLGGGGAIDFGSKLQAFQKIRGRFKVERGSWLTGDQGAQPFRHFLVNLAKLIIERGHPGVGTLARIRPLV